MRIRKDWPAEEPLYDEQVLDAAKVADALAHPARIMILRFIVQKNLARHKVTNKDIVQAFHFAQSSISQHISRLMVGGLLIVKKERTSSCYFARIGKLSAIMDTINKIMDLGDRYDMPDFLGSGAHEPAPYDPVLDFDEGLIGGLFESPSEAPEAAQEKTPPFSLT